MTNEQLKNALLNKKPVIYTNSYGIESEYKCVSAIRYTEKNGGFRISAEITALKGNSVTVCNPENLRFKEG